VTRITAILLAFSLGGAPALAAEGEPAEAQIRRLGQEAATRFQQRDYAHALTAYDEVALLLQDLPGREVELAYVRYNLARCHDELGHGPEALDAYERVDRARLPAEYAAEVARRADALERSLYGTVVVDCGRHPGAVVEVPDLGRPPQDCGVPWRRVPPGRHRLVATDPRGGKVEVVVAVSAGVEGLAAIPWTESGAVPPGQGGADHTVAWVLTGSGAAALMAGGVLNLLARNDVSSGDGAMDRQRVAPTRATYDRAVRDTDAAYDRAQQRATTSYVLFGAGALLGAGAIWAWLSSGSAEP
jgi:hypothetical protein